jgi:hypothetical protein
VAHFEKSKLVARSQTLLQLKIQPLYKGGIDCAEHNSSASEIAETVISELEHSNLQEDYA